MIDPTENGEGSGLQCGLKPIRESHIPARIENEDFLPLNPVSHAYSAAAAIGEFPINAEEAHVEFAV